MANEDIECNDRLRTYWTPAMERYFIDLMIEHLHRGNRVGHTFTKQAWTDMLTVFNAKFRSQYDKDVLKGRYTNLWKQYSDVKNLLQQSCFSWDESCQMVIASDSAWDAYFRANPDATSLYRTKPLLNFNDLCFIFGYATADGRYSRSSHDQDFDDFNQGPNMGDGFVGQLSSTERPRTDWTSSMDQYFIELMLDQLGRGNKSGDTFNKQSWTDMLTLFNEKFGPHHGKRVLRHRYQKLWKYYRDATVILKQDGFSWDGIQQMITAEDDVWNTYIKVNPNARTYRNKTLPSYDDLALIYGHQLDEGCHKHDQEKVYEYQNVGTATGEGKGRKPHFTNDRTRTYWTPPMDRYLVELLLDQVVRGNKLGQTFIAQAWADMTMSFNAYFKSNYEKDVLKNRFKHLRKQLNDVKSLLNMEGFSWDDEREMVTAEDSTWDVYIKNHPDARSFRVKTVPGFHKLCLIFGEESVHGQYSRLTLNMETGAELPILITGEDENDQYCIDITAPTMEWSVQMETYFIDMMLKLLHEGNSIDPLSDGSPWTQMITPFNEEFGLQCDKYALQEHYLVLMKKHHEISNLLSHSGFIWDGTQQMVIAENHVWETYIKEYPDAAAYKDKHLCDYINLCKIFCLRVSDRNLDSDVQTTYIPVELDEEGVEQASTEVEETHQLRKRPLNSSSEEFRGNKIQRRGCTIDDHPYSMTDEFRVVGLRRGQSSSYSVEDARSALEGISGMDDELVLEASNLFQDERKAKTFLALEGSLRKKWLLRKLLAKNCEG